MLMEKDSSKSTHNDFSYTYKLVDLSGPSDKDFNGTYVSNTETHCCLDTQNKQLHSIQF